ncbi:MAG TPA: hypothetical protein VGM83_14510 [Devosiaceae bacterium]|jgi:hypothetical protein
MNDAQRFLRFGTVVGSLIFGWNHVPTFLLLPPLASLMLLVAEQHAVRRRIGTVSWASEGYARFLVGTHLHLLLRTAMLSGVIFAIAAGMSSLLPRIG